jgi:hypothetical protein
MRDVSPTTRTLRTESTLAAISKTLSSAKSRWLQTGSITTSVIESRSGNENRMRTIRAPDRK